MKNFMIVFSVLLSSSVFAGTTYFGKDQQGMPCSLSMNEVNFEMNKAEASVNLFFNKDEVSENFSMTIPSAYNANDEIMRDFTNLNGSNEWSTQNRFGSNTLRFDMIKKVFTYNRIVESYEYSYSAGKVICTIE